ncbi:hypothetical protein E1267_27485 [Nonomuraea longispora]|uniref:Uncharacterized protein n=1 Tax=Nonomuraea longispora TaxID=1848320 RepID=A0A4R4N2Y6_9ACTN|nr:hypothetical protein [Nonomuraea longispora]TDC03058.1 hypothetical protein E1267_27485 [Nonomuraea longispora]
MLNALNFMMIGHHRHKTPGVLSPASIFIRDSVSGAVVHEGPDAGGAPGLVGELVTWLDEGDIEEPSCVRAAMATESASHAGATRTSPARGGGRDWTLPEERVDADGLNEAGHRLAGIKADVAGRATPPRDPCDERAGR